MTHRFGDLTAGLMRVASFVVLALAIDAPLVAAGPRVVGYRPGEGDGVSSGSGSVTFFGSVAAVLMIGGIVIWTSRRSRKR